MNRSTVQLLGPVQVAWETGEAPRFRSQRTMALLGYLAAAQRPVARDALATLSWPDEGRTRGRANLRRELHNLGSILPGCWQSDRQTVAFVPSRETRVDVHELLHLEAASRWAEAAALVRGDFLEGIHLDNNLEFETWLSGERERWCQRAERLLSRALAEQEQRGDEEQALQIARQLLQLMPWREQTHRQVMALLARQGRRSAALRQFERCKTVLHEQLGVGVAAETRRLYESIRDAPARRPEPCTASTPLVGRRRAWVQLQAAWRAATGKGPHVALLTGEAGIGKTRLAEELLAWANRQAIASATTRAFALDGQLAYAPVISWLRTDTIQRAISQLDEVWLTELARLLPELLAQPPALPRPEPLTESWQRQRLFEAIARAVLAVGQPLLLFVDDLHWSDRQTLAWLHYLLRFDAQAELLVVGTMRPEEVVEDQPLSTVLTELRANEQITEIALRRLDAGETARLATQLVGGELDAGAKASLYRETEGNPLFIVEALRAGVRDLHSPSRRHELSTSPGQTTPATSPPALPPKVQAVIEHRLNRLSPEARNVAEVAAVIGRRFTFAVVAKAGDQEENKLVAALDELWQRHIIHDQEGDVFDFTHDKIREVAVRRLSPPRRRRLHDRVAKALAEVAGAETAEVAVELASHYAQAGKTEKAVA